MREKTNKFGFRTGRTQTRLYCQRRWIEAGNFGFSQLRNCTTLCICVPKTKVLISFLFKGADQLRLCFHKCRLVVFLCSGSNVLFVSHLLKLLIVNIVLIVAYPGHLHFTRVKMVLLHLHTSFFKNFVCTVFICTQKCISFAHSFSVTFVCMFLHLFLGQLLVIYYIKVP